jgi:exodeoxyribonuclease V alpha subunit
MELKNDDHIGLFEVEYARFLLRNYPDTSKEALFCCLIAIKDQLTGNICTDLSEIDESSLFELFDLDGFSEDDLKSVLVKEDYVGFPGDYKPFILDEDQLYLHKYWSFENELVDWLLTKRQNDFLKFESLNYDFSTLFENSDRSDLQKVATCLALHKSFLVISGGPGTGKTYTVKKIIKALKIQNPDYKIAITAPTGKAAERLNESISDLDENIEATTLHRLLGANYEGEFKYNDKNKLFHDVVIIDEASMLDLRMWVGVKRALRLSTKLIVLGDKDQLSSVEAGSVLGDICSDSDNHFSENTSKIIEDFGLKSTVSNSANALNDNIVLLTKTYRSKESTGIPQFASAINRQNTALIDRALSESNQIEIIPPTNSILQELIKSYSKEKIEFSDVTQFICSNRKGIFGTENLNELVEHKIKEALEIPFNQIWYEGRRILITKNDVITGVSNGEIGTCFRSENDSFIIKFGDKKKIEVSRLKHYELAFAITIHKSQGSEFDRVCIFLPEHFNPVLSKELLYTSVTRAKENALVIGNRELIDRIVNKEIKRTSSIPKKLSLNYI